MKVAVKPKEVRMGRVLGFVGWPCAGKDEAVEYLRHTFQAHRFGHSDFIRRLAVEQGNWSPKTEELSALFEAQAAELGYGWIAEHVSQAIIELWTQAPRTLVVVSGVRNLAEVQVYRDLGTFELVKIEADFVVRLERARSRQRLGEQGMTQRRFREIERLPGNANISELMALPGPVIVNNGRTKVDFLRALDRLIHQGGAA